MRTSFIQVFGSDGCGNRRVLIVAGNVEVCVELTPKQFDEWRVAFGYDV